MWHFEGGVPSPTLNPKGLPRALTLLCAEILESRISREIELVGKAAQLLSQANERLPFIRIGFQPGLDLNGPSGEFARMALDFKIAHAANQVRQFALPVEGRDQPGSVVLALPINRSHFAEDRERFRPMGRDLDRMIFGPRKLGRN